jgi:tetratricopeptide (TPR) repeat protein
VKGSTNRERAEDLVFAAQEERSIAKARKRMHEALALDPDCVMAHLALAELAEPAAETVAHCRDAIAAAERVFAAEADDQRPPVWYHPIGRPYMNARFLLADTLWSIGDRRAAIEEAQAMLALNPGDNQGMRYVLMEWLMRAGSLAEIDALLASYADEASAVWSFSAALHRFRTHGGDATANKLLRAASASNAHVVPMLLGRIELPTEQPMTVGYGDESEAASYVLTALPSWFECGAVSWLEETAPEPARTPRATKRKR